MKQFHDIQADYDIQPGRDKALKVKDRYANNVATAKAVFPRWWERLAAIMSQAQAETALMEEGTFTAAYMNAYALGHMHAINAPVLGASADIRIPWGEFWTSRQLPIPIGSVTGSGTFGGGVAMGSTVLSPWHENWREDMTKRNVMVSQVRGIAGNSGYLESCIVDKIRLEGRAGNYYDPSYESCGVLMAGAGENNVIGPTILRADHFNNYGVSWEAATPGEIGNLTAFKNNLGGLGCIGTALATMHVRVISSDDNPYIVRCVRGASGDEGAMLNIGTIKLEGGTNTEAELGGKYKGQMVAELIGQGGITIDMLQLATTYYRVHSMFKVHPFLANYGSPQSAVIKVGMFKQNRGGPPAFEKFVVDTYYKKMYAAPGTYRTAYDAIYDSASGGSVKIMGAPVASEPYNLSDRLGHVVDPAVFNVAAGTPAFSFTGPPGGTTPPPPVTCTWVLGTPVLGSCIGGSQTKTTPYVSSAAGCTPSTPKPADVVTSQACTPPPPGTTLFSGPLSNGNQNFRDPITWTNVKSIAFEGMKLRTAPSYQSFANNGKINPDVASTLQITFLPNGGIVLSGPETTLAPAGTASATVAKNFTLNFSPARTFTLRGATPGNGNSLMFDATKVTVKQ